MHGRRLRLSGTTACRWVGAVAPALSLNGSGELRESAGRVPLLVTLRFRDPGSVLSNLHLRPRQPETSLRTRPETSSASARAR
jgi:hypothetical protein